MALTRRQHQPYYDDWNEWGNFPTPERLFDQFFGEPIMGRNHPSLMGHHPMSLAPYYMRPVRRGNLRDAEDLGTGFSDVNDDEKQFAVRLDVSHFRPEEVSVTTSGNNVVITGEHKERPDEHGFIERRFVRKYTLPKECNAEQMMSQLSRDGVLTVSAPKLAVEGSSSRPIPIAAAPIEEKKKKMCSK